MILALVVHSAAVQDRDGAKLVLAKLPGRFPRLTKIWADGGYAGQLVEWAKNLGGWLLDIVRRRDDQKGLVILAKRWIVERTFGWLNRYRRLSKDYETLTDSSQSMIRLAMINLMVHRLKPG